MENLQSTRSCLIEPILCEAALFACVDQKRPLSLHDLEALILLSDAVLLFDEVVYLDCHMPKIVYADSKKDTHQIANEYFRSHLKWEFVNCSFHVSNYHNSNWYYNMRRRQPEDRVEKIGRNVTRVHRPPHPDLGDVNIMQLGWLDKVNSAAAAIGAVVIHGESNGRNVL